MSIGKEAFRKCSLEYIGVSGDSDAEQNVSKLPSGITEIKPFTFSESHLKAISIVNSVKSIGNEAFSKCEELTTVYIGSGVNSIPEKAFSQCNNLETVHLSGTPVGIGASAFTLDVDDNPFVSNLYIRNANDWCQVESIDPIIKRAGSLYANDTKATTLVLRPISGTVNRGCFYNAPVEKVRVKAEKIMERSFYGSPMTALCLDVKYISPEAFHSCTELNTIYSLSPEPPAARDNTFSNYTDVRLFVPIGSYAKYRNSSYCWRMFPEIIESNFVGIDDIFKADYTDGSSGTVHVYNDDEETFGINPDNDYEIYRLDGVRMRIENIYNLPQGIYVVRQGLLVEKIVVK